MHGHELSLEVGRKFGECQSVARQYSAHFVAICFAFGGPLEVKETRIPRGNLYALVAELRGPAGNVFQIVERCCAARKQGQENRRSFHCVHARRLPKLDRASSYVLPWSAYVAAAVAGPCEPRRRGVNFRHRFVGGDYGSQCALRLDSSAL